MRVCVNHLASASLVFLIVFELLIIEGEETVKFGLARVPRSTQAEPVANTVWCAGTSLPDHSFRHGSRRLEKEGIVEGGQRLQGSVRANTPDGAEFAAGRVKNHQARIGRAAADKGIEGATVTILTLTDDPFVRTVGDIPDALGLVRKTLGPPILGLNKPLAERAMS